MLGPCFWHSPFTSFHFPPAARGNQVFDRLGSHILMDSVNKHQFIYSSIILNELHINPYEVPVSLTHWATAPTWHLPTLRTDGVAIVLDPTFQLVHLTLDLPAGVLPWAFGNQKISSETSRRFGAWHWLENHTPTAQCRWVINYIFWSTHEAVAIPIGDWWFGDSPISASEFSWCRC